jgi:glycosyltransferase involved in cell wall biosynthesis
MRFLFVHHASQGPFSLEELRLGRVCYGGSVARLRLLFWIAARGHRVELVGNVNDGELDGVRAVGGGDALARALAQSEGDLGVVVLNDPPNDPEWNEIRSAVGGRAPIVVWAGVPFDEVWLRRVRSRDVARIVCVSRWHRDLYRRYHGFDRLEVSYSGVDTDLLPAGIGGLRDQRLVISTSIPRRTKGIHNLLRAWRHVRRDVPDARLRLCGSAAMHDPRVRMGPSGILDADVEAEFSDLFCELPSSAERAGIELAGPRPLAEVYQDVAHAAVAVVNTNWCGSLETFCRAAVEAQVAGTPVIGAARGSLPEVVSNGVSGVLVDRESADALAAAIVGLLIDPARRDRMGAEGPAWAKHLADYAVIAADWEGVASRAISGVPAPIERREINDILRHLGYGQARLWARDTLRQLRSRSKVHSSRTSADAE